MKANPRSRAPLARSLPIAALIALLASCVPPPANAPAPAPAPAPAQRPAPAPVPTHAPAPATAWRDAPATPGDWRWGPTATGSAASFAGGQLVMRCDRAQAVVGIFRAAPGATAAVTVTIATSTGTRALSAQPVSGGIEATLPARDPLLDAMAFSRGRFAVIASGLPPLYVPSWTEVSRVIEDCR